MTAPRYTPVEMIARLVGFDTTSRNSNLPLIEFVEEYLASHGIESRRVPSPDRRKANLIATIGPRAAGGVILSGHTDVVPVDGQAWVTDPWVVTEKDGKLYGRGTCDMKSFSAIALALVPQFLERGLAAPIHFALSYDEEVGCIGAHDLIEGLNRSGLGARAVVVGEPTMMRVVNAHKGIRAMRTVVTGHEMHSSQVHKGVNAIAVAAELIRYLGELGVMAADEGDPTGRFDPPFSSVHVGVIAGGTALNIIPRSCAFDWEIRSLPGTDAQAIIERFTRYAAEKLLPRMKAISPDCDIETIQSHMIPPYQAAANSPAETLALKLTGRNAAEAVAYGTEAGLFEEGGFSTVVCGPGDIAQAHQPNEFVSLEQVDLCVGFFHRLMDELAAR